MILKIEQGCHVGNIYQCILPTLSIFYARLVRKLCFDFSKLFGILIRRWQTAVHKIKFFSAIFGETGQDHFLRKVNCTKTKVAMFDGWVYMKS
ncbi:hypothetical protein VNO78_28983 [Psophocarpus tetragonolobus]|uniref:Uncharacterized protein n=1 Tax=Psophocarpus tetragonolobus TaxID=3891 RepID=A0AAN9X041_PSOTE